MHLIIDRPRRFPVLSWLVIVAISASACATGVVATPSLTPQTVVPSPSATSAVLPTPPVAPASDLIPFTSSTYAYSIAYPSNWKVREARTQVSAIQTPHDTDPGVDYFSATAPEISDPALIVAGPQVEPGIMLDDWVAAIERDAASVDCAAPDTTEDLQIGGESARLLTWYNCHAYLLWGAVVHGDRAYHVIWVDLYARGENNPTLQSTDKALFQRMLASFAFTD